MFWSVKKVMVTQKRLWNICSYVSGNGARGPCDCEAEDVRLRNLQMKIGFLEQKIASRETEKIVLKKGPEVSPKFSLVWYRHFQ